ncbi:hypothetical protein [Gallaecimonas pentaromativorans]|uniref:hypothetical protein n=1 Tax=Gallaecimonas pentaromativorans TaxID=584787 RepID=UPI00067E68D9|nr:hypothetical protein [Gallaecimonas pentaromativorans]MED5523453.1 hypothetical protein [Pseudomonadota bacterium]
MKCPKCQVEVKHYFAVLSGPGRFPCPHCASTVARRVNMIKVLLIGLPLLLVYIFLLNPLLSAAGIEFRYAAPFIVAFASLVSVELKHY